MATIMKLEQDEHPLAGHDFIHGQARTLLLLTSSSPGGLS